MSRISAKYVSTACVAVLLAFATATSAAVVITSQADCELHFDCISPRVVTYNGTEQNCQCCAFNDPVNEGCTSATLKCALYCTSCDDNWGCASCADGLVYDAGVNHCIDPNAANNDTSTTAPVHCQIPNCRTCDSTDPTSCTACENGYMVASGRKACVASNGGGNAASVIGSSAAVISAVVMTAVALM